MATIDGNAILVDANGNPFDWECREYTTGSEQAKSWETVTTLNENGEVLTWPQ